MQLTLPIHSQKNKKQKLIGASTRRAPLNGLRLALNHIMVREPKP